MSAGTCREKLRGETCSQIFISFTLSAIEGTKIALAREIDSESKQGGSQTTTNVDEYGGGKGSKYPRLLNLNNINLECE